MSKKILFLLTSMIITTQCTESTEKKETISTVVVTESKNDSLVPVVSTISATENKAVMNEANTKLKSEELSAFKNIWNKICQKTNSFGLLIKKNPWWTAGTVLGASIIVGLTIWALSSDEQEDDSIEEQE